MAKEFTLKDLMIHQGSLRESYRSRRGEEKTALHWGQRKLLLSEIEFFDFYWDPKKIPRPLCVYAGAAHGIHLPLLSTMFPAFIFHLYDPSEFKIEESDKIKIFPILFTDEIAQSYAERDDIFFLSDIRSIDHKILQREILATKGFINYDEQGQPLAPDTVIEETDREMKVQLEKAIWEDHLTQQRWVLLMNPEHALLKFRLPYQPQKGEDPTHRVAKVEYLRGIVYLQVWEGQSSSETRLKPVKNQKGQYELATWDALEYEQWLFYHNSITREGTRYQNVFTEVPEPHDFPELLNDFDSTAEAFILKLYFEHRGLKNPRTEVKNLSRTITWFLNQQPAEAKDNFTLQQRRNAHIKSSHPRVNLVDPFREKKIPPRPIIRPKGEPMTRGSTAISRPRKVPTTGVATVGVPTMGVESTLTTTTTPATIIPGIKKSPPAKSKPGLSVPVPPRITKIEKPAAASSSPVPLQVPVSKPSVIEKKPGVPTTRTVPTPVSSKFRVVGK